MVKKSFKSKNKKKIGFKQFLKRTWRFIWEDDSLLSWIVNVVLAFILIKFIVYPGLGFALSTSHPIVAVVSGSMEHDEGNFDNWWDSAAECPQECTQEQWYSHLGISKQEFREFSFKNGFNKGDIMLLKGTKTKNINVGDVIVFQSSLKREPIIHRVVEINDEGSLIFETKGDNNAMKGGIDKNIHENNVIGKAVLRIPYLGWVKIGFVSLLKVIGINIS